MQPLLLATVQTGMVVWCAHSLRLTQEVVGLMQPYVVHMPTAEWPWGPQVVTQAAG